VPRHRVRYEDGRVEHVEGEAAELANRPGVASVEAVGEAGPPEREAEEEEEQPRQRRR